MTIYFLYTLLFPTNIQWCIQSRLSIIDLLLPYYSKEYFPLSSNTLFTKSPS